MRISRPYGERYSIESYSVEPKRKFFIACEGKKTEYQYLRGICENRIQLQINPLIEIVLVEHDDSTSSNPSKLLEQVKEDVKKSDSYSKDIDKVCLIVDRDRKSFKLRQYNEVVTKSEEENYSLFVSNPCFELWLLLHYSDLKEYRKQELLENKKNGSRSFVSACLKDKLKGSYSKSNLNFNRDFMNNIDIAVKNSQIYEQNLVKLENNLGTNIGLLIRELKKS